MLKKEKVLGRETGFYRAVTAAPETVWEASSDYPLQLEKFSMELEAQGNEKQIIKRNLLE